MTNTRLNFRSAYHPQTDSQAKVVNRSLKNYLHNLVDNNLKTWDQKLYQVEFVCNCSIKYNTSLSRFQANHGCTPQAPSTQPQF